MSKGPEETKCPGCGRAVILDNARRKTSHAIPLCDWWREALQSLGARPKRTTLDVEEENGRLVEFEVGDCDPITFEPKARN